MPETLARTSVKSPITSREMRCLELNAEYFGIPRILLMESAGLQVSLEIASRFKSGKTVAVFCGLGGNGGDGFVAARHLVSMGFKVTVILAGRAKDISDKSALDNWAALQPLRKGIRMLEVCDSASMLETTSDIVVDALLGTGTKGTLRPPVLQLVNRINSLDAFRIAVDIPSGIEADTGEVLGEAVKADLTVTFHRTKKGLQNAKTYVGELVVKDIGLPEEFESFAGPGDVSSILRPRPTDSHKGDFGRLLIIGGSETYSGAPALVALGAMRTGIDLAYIAAPEKAASAISSLSADFITVKLEGEHLNSDNIDALKPYVERVDAVVVGPGLGLHSETKKAVDGLVKLAERFRTPLLLDADGLKAFAGFRRKLGLPLVLTPHAGEYSILTGKKTPEELESRIMDVQKTAQDLDAVVLLKGAVDIVSDGKRSKLNFTGNPSMTVGGTGDVLSGIVGAFLANSIDPFEASVAGAFANGAAGDFVFKEKGYHMVATDLIEWIPKVLNDPMSHLEVRRASGKVC